jgi:hypothetical protein
MAGDAAGSLAKGIQEMAIHPMVNLPILQVSPFSGQGTHNRDDTVVLDVDGFSLDVYSLCVLRY